MIAFSAKGGEVIEHPSLAATVPPHTNLLYCGCSPSSHLSFPLSSSSPDPLRVSVESDVGSSRVWSGPGHLLVRQNCWRLGRTE